MTALRTSDRDIEVIFLDDICKVLRDGTNGEIKALSLTLDIPKARQKERREQERNVVMIFPPPVTSTVSNIPVVESLVAILLSTTSSNFCLPFQVNLLLSIIEYGWWKRPFCIHKLAGEQALTRVFAEFREPKPRKSEKEMRKPLARVRRAH